MAEPRFLTCRHELELVPSAPFLFDATVFKPDHFPSSDTRWEPGTRWQTMLWQGERLGLKIENRGTVDAPRVTVAVHAARPLASAFLEGLAVEIVYRYNLDLDLAGFYRCFEDHPVLGPILARWRGMRPMHPGSLYEYLIIAIVLQNCTVRRSVSMMQTLFEHYGVVLHYDGQALSCFWEPPALAGVTEDELRGLKVGYRAKSIERVTRAFIRGEIDEAALRGRPCDEQRRALLGLYGIGPASVGYILSDVFHQHDEMQHISPWEQKIYTRLFFPGRETADDDEPLPVDVLLAYFDREFAGYRGLAVNYIWEDLWWRRRHQPVPWLEKLIRL